MTTAPISLSELTLKTPGCIKIFELLEKEDVQRIRVMSAHNERAVADELATNLLTSTGTLASAVTLLQNDGNNMTVYDYNKKEYVQFDTISIVFLGEMVMDIFRSDKLIPSKEYLSKLMEVNPNLDLSAEGCPWLFSVGTDFIDLAEMCDYEYGD